MLAITLALFLVIVMVVFIVRKNLLKNLPLTCSLPDLAFVSEKKQLGTILATVDKSRLNYSYEILEKASN